MGSIFGLPIHILVIHVVVVLGPISALLTIGYAWRPSWRWYLKWPVIALVAATGVTAAIAGWSGDALVERLKELGTGGEQLAKIEAHAEAGEVAWIWCFLAMIAIILIIIYVLPAGNRPGVAQHVTDKDPPTRSATAQTVAVWALTIISIVELILVIRAGHLGAVASWSTVYGS